MFYTISGVSDKINFKIVWHFQQLLIHQWVPLPRNPCRPEHNLIFQKHYNILWTVQNTISLNSIHFPHIFSYHSLFYKTTVIWNFACRAIFLSSCWWLYYFDVRKTQSNSFHKYMSIVIENSIYHLHQIFSSKVLLHKPYEILL